MRKKPFVVNDAFIVPLIILCLAITNSHAQIQNYQELTPDEIWQEFTELRPTKNELEFIFRNSGEPYRKWAFNELIVIGQTDGTLINILTTNIEPYSGAIWEYLKTYNRRDALITVFRRLRTNISKLYIKESFEILWQQDLTVEELILMGSASETYDRNKYLDVIWPRIMSLNPSNDALIGGIMRVSSLERKRLLYLELLNRPLSDDDLIDILCRSGSLRNEFVGIYITEQLISRSPLIDNVLTLLAVCAPITYNNFLRQMYKAGNYRKNPKNELKKIMTGEE